jgi:hypothetical protein
MKHPVTGPLLICLLLSIFSCKKDTAVATPTRTIQYVLYTEKDFTNDYDTITFSLIIRSGGQFLLNRPINPMRVADIPSRLNKLVFNETVPPGHEQEKLAVGFIYQIKNVGESWLIDSCKVGETLHVVDYSFQ